MKFILALFLALPAFGQCGPGQVLAPIGGGARSCVNVGSTVAVCATNPPTTGTAGQVCVIGTSQYLCPTTGSCSFPGDWTLVNSGPFPLVAFNPNTATSLTCPGTSGAWFQASTALTGTASIPTVTCPVTSGTAVTVQISVLQGSTVYGLTLPSPFNVCNFTSMSINDTMTEAGTYDGTNYLDVSCTVKTGEGNVVVASSPGVGIAHFAGSTQTVTSSAVNLAGGSNEVTGVLPVGNLPVLHGQCTEVWGGSGTSFALTAGDDAISNNTCYNDSGATRTITAIECRSDAASNSVTVNPSFGSAGTGTSILTGALTCGNSYAFSASGTLDTGAHIAWTTGTGVDPVMAGTLTGSTSIALLIEYTYQPY